MLEIDIKIDIKCQLKVLLILTMASANIRQHIHHVICFGKVMLHKAAHTPR